MIPVDEGKASDLIIESCSTDQNKFEIEVTTDGKNWNVLQKRIMGKRFDRFRILAVKGDVINFRTNNSKGVTLARFLVVEDLDA